MRPFDRHTALFLACLLLLTVFAAVADGGAMTFSFPIAFFAGCAVLALALPNLERWTARVLRHRAEKLEPRRLDYTTEGLRYVSCLGSEHRINWRQIVKVSWSEPPWGPLGSLPYWTVYGDSTSFEIDDWWGEDVKLLPSWFARTLPGFDPSVIEKARVTGFFKTDSSETLVCWERVDE